MHARRTTPMLAFVLAFGSLLAGCAQGPSAELKAALPGRTVTAVEVVPAANMAAEIVPRLDGVTHADQIKAASHQIKGSITSKLGSLPQGRAPTKLVVTLTKVDVASNAGYALGGLSTGANGTGGGGRSSIEGTAKLVDAKTGAMVGSLGGIRVTDQSMLSAGGGGAVGIAIAAAAVMANAAVAENNDRMQTLSESFSERVIAILRS